MIRAYELFVSLNKILIRPAIKRFISAEPPGWLAMIVSHIFGILICRCLPDTNPNFMHYFFLRNPSKIANNIMVGFMANVGKYTILGSYGYVPPKWVV